MKWSGHVDEVTDTHVYARLVCEDGTEENMQMPIGSVRDEDLDVLEPGMLCRMEITEPDGVFSFELVRLPPWTAEEIAAAEIEAAKQAKFFSVE